MSQKLARAGSRITFDGDAIDMAAYGGIAAIAIGKAAVAMARGFAELFADDFAFEGILVAPHESVAEVRGFRSIGAAHPVPDEGSVLAARASSICSRDAMQARWCFFCFPAAARRWWNCLSILA